MTDHEHCMHETTRTHRATTMTLTTVCCHCGEVEHEDREATWDRPILIPYTEPGHGPYHPQRPKSSHNYWKGKS